MSGRVAPLPPASRVSVHIDVVSVQGIALSAAQAAQFQSALEQELSRLAGLDTAAASLEPGAHPAILAPSLQLGPALQASELGRQVGRRLWAAMDRAGYASRTVDS